LEIIVHWPGLILFYRAQGFDGANQIVSDFNQLSEQLRRHIQNSFIFSLVSDVMAFGKQAPFMRFEANGMLKALKYDISTI
jgi:hypothetical protein